jgi:SAM-dependent methyltransferase
MNEDTLSRDPGYDRFKLQQVAHWNKVADEIPDGSRRGSYYHDYVAKLYRFYISPGQRVIEFGCGSGNLLAGLSPSFGKGIDFSPAMIASARQRHPDLDFEEGDILTYQSDERYDVVILSDLVNSLFDVQRALEVACNFCAPGGRIMLNYFSHLWKMPLKLAGAPGMSSDLPEPNWLTPHDIRNLLHLAGAEPVRESVEFLFPFNIPIITSFFNRFLARLWPFRSLCLTHFVSARPVPVAKPLKGPDAPSVSVVIPARNEAGNVPDYFKRVPRMGSNTEIIIVEGNSTDDTYAIAEKEIAAHPKWDARLFKQPGKGKADAVRVGFQHAKNDVLMILDADLTVVPEDLPRFYKALVEGRGEYINGVRLVYPMEGRAMRFLNLLGNKFFSYAFSWLLGQPIRDTLCGTKVMYRKDYERLAANRSYFGDFDPFGDYDLIFGAAKMGLKMVDMPIRYRDRTYGDTNIQRWRHGMILLRMVAFAARRIKFV